MSSETTPEETQDAHVDQMMSLAELALARGFKEEASEHAWAAVDHQLRFIANRRGLEYTAHQHVYGIVDQLADELGNQELRTLFAAATNLHKNYLVDSVPVFHLEYQIDRVRDLLEVLRQVDLG